MNSKIKSRAKKLLELESILNKSNNYQIPIGSLLSDLFVKYYKSNISEGQVIYLIKIILFTSQGFINSIRQAFCKRNRVSYTDSLILFSKVDNIPQCNALIDPLHKYFIDKSMLRSFSGKNEIVPYRFYQKPQLIFVFKALKITIQYFQVFKKIKSETNILELAYNVVFKLNEFFQWQSFFKNSNFQLVVVDFDRNNRNNSMVLAANSLGIKTITLVHGVINPPYGYWPILANEIWCWSKFQSKQLQENGVVKKRIKIVGSAIVDKVVDKTIEKIKVIGVALNPIEDKKNIKMINYIWKNLRDYNYKIVVKLHPSMKKKDWMNNFKDIHFFLHNELFLNDFFKNIDLLIVGNSGVGFEAIVNKIPIWVYRVNESKFGHDYVMVNFASCPDISKINNFQKQLKNSTAHNYLKELLKVQRHFVENEFYEYLGKDSTNLIIKKINRELDVLAN